MPSSRLLCRAAVVRTDVLKERCASNIRVTKIGEQGTLGITSNGHMLRISSQHVSVAGYG
jgi:hypothetical protein